MTVPHEGSDTPLSTDELQRLAPLLDTLIPPRPDRGLPGGSDVGFGERCDDPALRAIVRVSLGSLYEWGGVAFEALDAPQRIELVKRLERERVLEFRELLKSVVARYYLDDRVMRAVGVEPRPPFPEGYTVDDGDLTLLEPVYERGPMYRSVTSEETR
jgi:hypothetical protein